MVHMWLPLLRLIPDGGIPLRRSPQKKLHEGQQMAKVQNGVETAENFNRLSMAHESYRRQMTDRQTDL